MNELYITAQELISGCDTRVVEHRKVVSMGVQVNENNDKLNEVLTKAEFRGN